LRCPETGYIVPDTEYCLACGKSHWVSRKLLKVSNKAAKKRQSKLPSGGAATAARGGTR